MRTRANGWQFTWSRYVTVSDFGVFTVQRIHDDETLGRKRTYEGVLRPREVTGRTLEHIGTYYLARDGDT
jgi:hypothetical protein